MYIYTHIQYMYNYIVTHTYELLTLCHTWYIYIHIMLHYTSPDKSIQSISDASPGAIWCYAAHRDPTSEHGGALTFWQKTETSLFLQLETSWHQTVSKIIWYYDPFSVGVCWFPWFTVMKSLTIYFVSPEKANSKQTWRCNDMTSMVISHCNHELRSTGP